MSELQALVDFENVQPSFEGLGKLAPGFTDVWLFHGPHQVKQAQQWPGANKRVALVPRSGKGSNALDFHLSFYLGYVAARHPDAQLVVVANDTGYDPMLAHARLLKFTVKRVGYKPKSATKKVAKSTNPGPASSANAAPAKMAVSANAPAPARKVAVKKASIQKAVAKKVPVKKAVAPKPVASARVKVTLPALTAQAKAFARIKKAVSKMGAERPTKTKSFLRHSGAMVGQASKAEQIDVVVAKLEKDGAIGITGDAFKYLPSSAGCSVLRPVHVS